MSLVRRENKEDLDYIRSPLNTARADGHPHHNSKSDPVPKGIVSSTPTQNRQTHTPAPSSRPQCVILDPDQGSNSSPVLAEGPG